MVYGKHVVDIEDSRIQVYAYAIERGLGLTLHKSPTISLSDRVKGLAPLTLKEGMVLAPDTGTGNKDGKHGARLEEMVVVKDGYDLLTRRPVDHITNCWR